MGMHASAAVILAVDPDELIAEHQDVRTVTRYNEKTGKPYDKTIEKVSYSIGDNEFDDYNEAVNWFDRYYDKESEFRDLELHTEYWGREQRLVGITVASSGEYNWSTEISPVALNDASVKMNNILGKLNCHTEPSLYLVLDVTD